MIRTRSALVAIALAVLVWTALPSADQSPEARALQEAIDLIESKGDFAAALAKLEIASKSRDRQVAARALWYTAQVYERTDLGRAVATYERVVAEFREQVEIAEAVRMRLAALAAGPSSAPAPRRRDGQERSAWNCPGAPEVNVIAHDGRHLRAPSSASRRRDRCSTRRRPARQSESYPSTSQPGARRERRPHKWSPDGRSLAYASPDGRWVAGSRRNQVIYTISSETGEARERLRVDASEGFNVGSVAEWLPDSSASR